MKQSQTPKRNSYSAHCLAETECSTNAGNCISDTKAWHVPVSWGGEEVVYLCVIGSVGAHVLPYISVCWGWALPPYVAVSVWGAKRLLIGS